MEKILRIHIDAWHGYDVIFHQEFKIGNLFSFSLNDFGRFGTTVTAELKFLVEDLQDSSLQKLCKPLNTYNNFPQEDSKTIPELGVCTRHSLKNSNVVTVHFDMDSGHTLLFHRKFELKDTNRMDLDIQVNGVFLSGYLEFKVKNKNCGSQKSFWGSQFSGPLVMPFEGYNNFPPGYFL